MWLEGLYKCAHRTYKKRDWTTDCVDEVYVKVTIILITDKKKLLPDPPRMEWGALKQSVLQVDVFTAANSALQAWCMLWEEANVCTSLAARLRDWMRPSPGLLNHSKQLGSRTTTVHVRSLLFSSMWLPAPVEPAEPAQPFPCRRPRSAVWRTAGAALTGGQGGAAAWRPCRRSALSARSPVHPGWPWLKGVWRSSPHPAHSARCCLCRHLLRSSSFNKLRGTDGTVIEGNNCRK